MIQLEHIYQMVVPDLQSDFPPLATSVNHPHNLPVRLTSFIGRNAEIEAVCHMLRADIRLLSITGVGGTGKTSLALQAGWELLESFRDGVFFVDLAPIKNPGLVITAVAGALSVHELSGKSLKNEAVRLFIERAQAIQPDIHLTTENGPDIAEICRRLDGLPLAIELIAARLRLFNLQQLLQQLTNRLRLLSSGWRDLPPRHQTMRSAIAWSCELLAEDEKRLFYRLAVFPGSFTLEAAEGVYRLRRKSAPPGGGVFPPGF